MPQGLDAVGYEAAVQDYITRYYDGERNAHLTLIDESTAPDGSLRRSYRLVNAPEPPFPPGQLDVFFLLREGSLAVVELYSADSTGNTLVPVFQQILDSLEINAA